MTIGEAHVFKVWFLSQEFWGGIAIPAILFLAPLLFKSVRSAFHNLPIKAMYTSAILIAITGICYWQIDKSYTGNIGHGFLIGLPLVYKLLIQKERFNPFAAAALTWVTLFITDLIAGAALALKYENITMFTGIGSGGVIPGLEGFTDGLMLFPSITLALFWAANKALEWEEQKNSASLTAEYV